jgi:hypothetical protein
MYGPNGALRTPQQAQPLKIRSSSAHMMGVGGTNIVCDGESSVDQDEHVAYQLVRAWLGPLRLLF